MSEFKTFGEFLAFHRKAAGLSQRALAAKAGISKTTVYNIEANIGQSDRGLPPRPTVETIDALCKALKADAATARLMVYPPDEHGTSVLLAGEQARLPEFSEAVDIRRTIADLRCQAHLHAEAAERLTRVAKELESLL